MSASLRERSDKGAAMPILQGTYRTSLQPGQLVIYRPRGCLRATVARFVRYQSFELATTFGNDPAIIGRWIDTDPAIEPVHGVLDSDVLVVDDEQPLLVVAKWLEALSLDERVVNEPNSVLETPPTLSGLVSARVVVPGGIPWPWAVAGVGFRVGPVYERFPDEALSMLYARALELAEKDGV